MTITILLAAALLAETKQEVMLFPNGAPGSEGITKKEVVEPPTGDRTFIRVSSIHKPSITVYLPAKEKATGAAIVIAPGGGHRILAMHEGYDIAEWLNTFGVAGFVLKYRLAREEGSPYKVDIHALADAQQALRVVRQRAGEWGVDPKRVGIMGFSAGGEVAMLASTQYGSDPAARPDFQVLVYPGIRPDPLMALPPDTPPAFLICTFDDRGPATGVPALFNLYRRANVQTEMHVYARGGHGYGIRKRPLPVSGWSERMREWMNDLGLLKK